MKGGWLLFIAGAVGIALAAKKDDSVSTVAQNASVVLSPTGQAALDNINDTYGTLFTKQLVSATLSSNTAGEVFDQLGYNAPLNVPENLIDTSSFVTPGGTYLKSPNNSFTAYIAPIAVYPTISYVTQRVYDQQAHYVSNLQSKAYNTIDPTLRAQRMRNYENAKAELDSMRVQ